MNITVYDVLGTLFLQHIRWIVHRRSIPSLKVCEKYPLPDQHENHASYTSDRRRCLSVDAEDVFHRLMQTFPLQLSCIISLAIFKKTRCLILSTFLMKSDSVAMELCGTHFI